MTNKEAIFYLKQVREDYEGKEFVEGKEAIDLAIQALEERPHIIDNCDMNVFEPEKYMEGGAEE